MHDLILLGRKLDEAGVGLMNVQERIDTSSSGGRLVVHLFGALAEFERNLVRERTQAGLNAAHVRGRKGGRPKVLEPTKRRLAVDLHNSKKHTVREICRMMGISKPTFNTSPNPAAARDVRRHRPSDETLVAFAACAGRVPGRGVEGGHCGEPG